MTDLSRAKAVLLQEDFLRFIQTRLGTEPWVTVYQVPENPREDYGFFCALIPNSKVTSALENESWELHIGNGKPGCVVSYPSSEREEVRYLRYGRDDGLEPLVIQRSFHDLKPAYLEILEEFRHFHDLYQDPKSNKYIKLDEDGNEEEVAVVGDRFVRIRLKELKQFLAIKEMHLAIYFDRIQFSDKTIEELGLQPIRETLKGEGLVCHRFVGNYEGSLNDHKSLSRVLGKKLVPGTTKEKSGFWPYEEEENEFEEFIIGIDSEGNPIKHTCDPDRLSNYFGANLGAPHYLTPVFFRREVLNKYYATPSKYSVEDGFLRCGGLWGVRMDNNHGKYVIVYLGDLGRDLSANERSYWKAYNVPPDGKISKVELKRGFLAEFADPEAADLLFKYRFEAFHKKWVEANGWSLFKPLAAEDQHYYTALRIPLMDDPAELDNQALALAKILVDSINEEEIQRRLTTKQADAKGITKLENYLREQGLTDYQPHVKFLRNLYDLRHGSGHRKGNAYEKAAAAFQVTEKDRRTVFEDILKTAVNLLEYLTSKLLKSSTTENSR